MLLCGSSGSRGKGNREMFRLETCRSLLREQPVLVVLAWSRAASQGVDDLELLVPDLVEVDLVLLVLLQPRALSNILVTSSVPCKPEANAVYQCQQIYLKSIKPAANTSGQALFHT